MAGKVINYKFGTFNHSELFLGLKNHRAMAGFEPVSLDVSTNEIGQIFRLKYVSLDSNNYFSWQLFSHFLCIFKTALMRSFHWYPWSTGKVAMKNSYLTFSDWFLCKVGQKRDY